MNELRHLDLFSGIGGFSIAAESAGFRTVAFVEREPFCQKILAQHWPRVPILADIYQTDSQLLNDSQYLCHELEMIATRMQNAATRKTECPFRQSQDNIQSADNQCTRFWQGEELFFALTSEPARRIISAEARKLMIMPKTLLNTLFELGLLFRKQAAKNAESLAFLKMAEVEFRRTTATITSLLMFFGFAAIATTNGTKTINPFHGGQIESGRVSLLTGGFPCQPFSLAGERRGKADDRFIWPEMLRVIQATNPDWIIGENVAGLDGLGLDDCISDLEASGYEVAPPLEIPACAVDARHIRNRIWIVANSMREQVERQHTRGLLNVPTGSGEDVANTASSERDRGGDSWRWRDRPTDGSEILSDPTSERQSGPGRPSERRSPTQDGQGQANHALPMCEHGIWPTEPDVGRVANGIPNRTHRLKGLGNAIVPQVAYQIIKAIHAEIIKTEKR